MLSLGGAMYQLVIDMQGGGAVGVPDDLEELALVDLACRGNALTKSAIARTAKWSRERR
jgi:hypothetical protein